MKLFFSILCFILISGELYAQELDCCKSVIDVMNTLEGDWLLKKDSQNKIYRFHFENGEGTVDVLEELNLPPKAEHTAIKDEFEITESQVQITKEADGFYIELVYAFGSAKAPIKELTENRLIYGSGASEHVFTKDEH